MFTKHTILKGGPRTIAGRRFLATIVAIAAVAALSACVPIAPAPSAGEAAPAPSDSSTTQDASLAEQLPNLAYPVDAVPGGTAQLEDGTFSEPAAPGSASMITVNLGDQQAYGDLNGDGVDDAATTLVVETGGSGTFIYLSAVLDENGTGVPVSSVMLGDRITVQSLAIADEQITVDFLTVAEGEPMSAEPSVPVTQVYVLQDNQLVLVQ